MTLFGLLGWTVVDEDMDEFVTRVARCGHGVPLVRLTAPARSDRGRLRAKRLAVHAPRDARRLEVKKSGTSRVARLLDAVDAETARLLDSASLREWLGEANLRRGDLVIFNNSVLSRDGGITTGPKNAKYLCVKVGDDGVPAVPSYVVTMNRVNKRFKELRERQLSSVHIISLHEAVASEVDRLGVIVRTLVGRIGDDVPSEVKIENVSGLELLRYDPDLGEGARLEDLSLSVGRLDDIDIVWAAVKDEVSRVGFADESKLADQFESAFGDLREAAGRPVDVNDVDPSAPSILGSVIERIEDQIDRYASALEAYHADSSNTEAFNEILRVAYNFADGTKGLLGLVVGLSDLKPVLLWLTIAAQAKLTDRFAALPFALVGKAKPSFDKYRSAIAGARNRAFHDVFAFGRPFHVSLSGDAFKSAELRLFQEYGRKARAGLDFEDKELVELLAGFTRVSERGVPLGFWAKNLDVMRAVADLTRALRDALLLVSLDE
jgi:hypothetical protein